MSSRDFVGEFQVTARNLERDNLEPRIHLDVTVDADASLVEAKVTGGNVNARTARWALREIRLCRFTPALAAGVPVRGVARLQVGLSARLVAAGGRIACDFPVMPREGRAAPGDSEVVVRVRFAGGREPAGTEIVASSGLQAVDRAAIDAAKTCGPASTAPAPETADIRFHFKP